MWWWHGDWNWGAWVVMTLSMVLFWGLVIWGVVVLARSTGADRAAAGEPERILAERFARGEIDAAEYRERMETIRSAAGGVVDRR